jgi:hypothetical protein
VTPSGVGAPSVELQGSRVRSPAAGIWWFAVTIATGTPYAGTSVVSGLYS